MFVLDASVAACWLLDDEDDADAEAALERLAQEDALLPQLSGMSRYATAYWSPTDGSACRTTISMSDSVPWLAYLSARMPTSIWIPRLRWRASMDCRFTMPCT